MEVLIHIIVIYVAGLVASPVILGAFESLYLDKHDMTETGRNDDHATFAFLWALWPGSVAVAIVVGFYFASRSHMRYWQGAFNDSLRKAREEE